jgi:hypothetical protein
MKRFQRHPLIVEAAVGDDDVMAKTDAIQETPLLLRIVRREPHFYSAVCKAALFYSRNVLFAKQKKSFRDQKDLFAMNASEAAHFEELKRTGITIFPGFFDAELIDRIYQKADRLFADMRLNFQIAYSVQNGRRTSLEGLTYEELAATEKVIYLDAPLGHIPECIPIVFHETILKIVTTFMGYMPVFAPQIVRDFPHNRPKESSNFHKDCDYADRVAAYIYLVDTDSDRHGGLVYIPFSNRYDTKSCRPRGTRDMGIDANDGRMSDNEVEKYYPPDKWQLVKVPRGSLVIFHGNGIHKGPVWTRYGDPSNLPRTAIALNFAGFRMGSGLSPKGPAIGKENYDRLTELQKLFAESS